MNAGKGAGRLNPNAVHLKHNYLWRSLVLPFDLAQDRRDTRFARSSGARLFPVSLPALSSAEGRKAPQAPVSQGAEEFSAALLR